MKESLLALIQGQTPLKRYSNRTGGEYRGACPKCGGDAQSDRFIVWPAVDRYWCRQCRWAGDTIQYLRDVRGYSFQEAARLVGKDLPPRPADPRKHAAIELVLQRYFTWVHDKSRALSQLHDEIWLAEMAFRSICRAPDVWTDEEQTYWILYLSDLYFALTIAVQEHERMSDPRDCWELWREQVTGVRQ